MSNSSIQAVGRGEIVELPAPGLLEAPRVFHLQGISKHWPGDHGFKLTVPHLTIRRGEKLALVGFSGCGKSTLLDLLAMVLRPDEAARFAFFPTPEENLDVAVAWQRKDLDGLARARMRHMGYVLQTGGLFPFLSVRDNISLSRQGLGLPAQNAVETAAERLGIERHLDKFPSQLSVGERQRVAIARAMAHEPSVVIADEPTASLDPINADEIMAVFTELVEEKGVTLIVATHEWERVEKGNFRRLEFHLKKNTPHGIVRATVSG
ncbi:MAG: ABC transporter ATP-binding protein [Desulfobacterales bacterium]|nr:MAG: ABC transporter ATP-binding protein [Desulfobacterales bacterium]